MTIPGIPHPAVPYGSWVVISGATGFIGSHVVDQALAAGYKVRGTTRSVDRGAWAKHYFGEKYGEAVFDLVQVKDMALDNAFDEAVTGKRL
jgi:nucleoside-diphosphate-sugar epimerase